MPFIRHTRDKRGYETTYVMHAYRPMQGPQRTRVLYLFRSPSHVKLGRRPLDEETREALEHTHPDVSFDWSALARESTMVRSQDSRERPVRARRPPPSPARQAPSPTPVIVEDHSPLGRVVGAERASAIRKQYADLLQRIGRRARTPEDRDRLTERAQRLNPDDWSDEASVQAQLDPALTEWEALAAELPARRRGRRGGRRRERGAGDDTPDSPGEDRPGEPSEIMAEGSSHADFEDTEDDGPDRGAGAGGDRGGVGSEREPEPGDGLPDDD